MRYYVLAPTGERYGPADLPTLNEWASSNRLFPTSRLMEEMSGNVVAASSVAGIGFPQASPPPPGVGVMNPPPPGSAYQPQPPTPPHQAHSNYYRPGYAPTSVSAHDGKNDLWLAFGMVLLSPVLSLFCIFGFTTALVGISASWRAYQRGQRIALIPLVLNIGCLVFWGLARFVFRHWLLDSARGY
jgi:hypothetical protein